MGEKGAKRRERWKSEVRHAPNFHQTEEIAIGGILPSNFHLQKRIILCLLLLIYSFKRVHVIDPKCHRGLFETSSFIKHVIQVLRASAYCPEEPDDTTEEFYTTHRYYSMNRIRLLRPQGYFFLNSTLA